MNILVVEESKLLRRTLANVFEYWEIEADFLKNYNEAITLCDNSSNPKKYTSALLEITDASGRREILAKLKEINPDIRTIACYNNPYEGLANEFNQHGFNNVLIKPYHFEDLKRALDIQ